MLAHNFFRIKDMRQQVLYQRYITTDLISMLCDNMFYLSMSEKH